MVPGIMLATDHGGPVLRCTCGTWVPQLGQGLRPATVLETVRSRKTGQDRAACHLPILEPKGRDLRSRMRREHLSMALVMGR